MQVLGQKENTKRELGSKKLRSPVPVILKLVVKVIGICYLLVMKWILVLCVFLVGSSSYGINYFRCERDADCVKAYGGCGRYLSVHKRYKELYEAKAHKADKVANCLPPSARDKKRKFEGEISCLKQSCRLLLPKAEKE